MTSIKGIGCAQSKPLVNTSDFLRHAKKFNCQSPKQELILEELYRRTGIQTRSTVLIDSAYGRDGEALFADCGPENPTGPGTSARMQTYAREITPLACQGLNWHLTLHKHQLIRLLI